MIWHNTAWTRTRSSKGHEFAVPNRMSYNKLMRLVRYLVAIPRLVYHYPLQFKPIVIQAYVDTGFPGCKAACRSTSGGVAMHGVHAVKQWSKTQSTVCLCAGEAQLGGSGDGLAQAIGLQSIARDMGLRWHTDLYTDATAAIGIAHRKARVLFVI